MRYKSFDQWFAQLKFLADECEWELGYPDSYKEYFDDGDSPADTLALEMSYIVDEYFHFDDFDNDIERAKYSYKH